MDVALHINKEFLYHLGDALLELRRDPAAQPVFTIEVPAVDAEGDLGFAVAVDVRVRIKPTVTA